MEAEGRARMSWHARLWRRYRKPSAVVLDQFSELQAERVLDIIEEALGSELANKQQQALKHPLAGGAGLDLPLTWRQQGG